MPLQQLSLRQQYLLLAVLLLTLVIDGLDLQLLSLVAPLVLTEWNVDKAALGPALSAAMLGMSIGAGVGGWLGDRFGRRRVLSLAVLFFGCMTISVVTVDDLTSLTALRLLGGLGFGAAAPNAIALASEWLGGSLRLRAISAMSIGAPLGGLIGAMILIGYLAELGWRGSFVLCGGLALAMVLMILRVVPKSAAPARSSDVLEPIADAVDAPSLRFVIGTGLAFFCISFVAYGCIAWLPVMVTATGRPLGEGLQAVISFNLFAVGAALLAGWFIGRFGSRGVLAISLTIGGVATVLLLFLLGPLRDSALGMQAHGALLLTGALAGGSTGTVLACLYVVLASGYPPRHRSSGLGVGMMLGRGGGIFSTLTGGALLGATPAASWPFFVAMLAGIAGTVIGLTMIDRHVSATPR